MTAVINLHKVNGKRPPFDTYIGRAVAFSEFTKNSIWANPFTYAKYGDDALRLYEVYIRRKIADDPSTYDLQTLKGRRLGCWCVTTRSFSPPFQCHGQILMKLLHDSELFFPHEPR